MRAWPLKDAEGRIVRWFGTNTDIEELKRAQRLLAVLSRVNEAIVRIHEEPALQPGGVPHRRRGRRVPAGLDRLRSRRGGDTRRRGRERGRLPVRDQGDGGRRAGTRDRPAPASERGGRSSTTTSPANAATSAWSASARRHGFRASAAFPLRRRGKAVGALSLYAARPGVFDAEHVRLLEALSADLSYALDALQLDELRRAAETALARGRSLRESERSLREVDERKNDFLAVLSHELRNPLAPITTSLYILEQHASRRREGRAREGGDRTTGRAALPAGRRSAGRHAHRAQQGPAPAREARPQPAGRAGARRSPLDLRAERGDPRSRARERPGLRAREIPRGCHR